MPQIEQFIVLYQTREGYKNSVLWIFCKGKNPYKMNQHPKGATNWVGQGLWFPNGRSSVRTKRGGLIIEGEVGCPKHPHQRKAEGGRNAEVHQCLRKHTQMSSVLDWSYLGLSADALFSIFAFGSHDSHSLIRDLLCFLCEITIPLLGLLLDVVVQYIWDKILSYPLLQSPRSLTPSGTYTLLSGWVQVWFFRTPVEGSDLSWYAIWSYLGRLRQEFHFPIPHSLRGPILFPGY